MPSKKPQQRGRELPVVRAGVMFPTSNLCPSDRRGTANKWVKSHNPDPAPQRSPDTDGFVPGAESPAGESILGCAHGNDLPQKRNQQQTEVQRSLLHTSRVQRAASTCRETSPQVPKQKGRGSCSGLRRGNASRGRPTVGTVSWHARQTGTGPKSVCPMLGKAKTQNIRVWSKERFTDRKGTN